MLTHLLTDFRKKSISKIGMPITIAILTACSAGSPETENQRSIPEDFVQGSFVIQAASGTTGKELGSVGDDLAKGLNCEIKEPQRVKWSNSGVVNREMHDTFHMKFENCDLTRDDTKEILSTLSGAEGVIAAEAEAVAKASPIIENDPYKSSQGHLDFIKRDEACELAATSDKPVIVAVVDSGVDKDHPDLKDAFYRDSRGEIIGANFVGAGSSMPHDSDWDDGSGHGTHVAGLVAATANNNRGGVGVASCANVKIMPIRVLNDEGRGTSIEIERGVKWAADNGAQIINMSLGFTSMSFSSSRPSFYRSLYSSLARQNVVVFAAAGNDGYENGTSTGESSGKRWHYPSSYDNVISVAATNNYGRLTSFSNYGDRVDIAAPGYQLYSTVPGSYRRMSGTSMASPVAAGAYALGLATVIDNIDSDRIDVSEAEDLLGSTTLERGNLSRNDVAAGGVIDTKSIVSKLLIDFPAPIQDPDPIDTPNDDTPDFDDPDTDTPDVDTPNDDTPADQPSEDPAPAAFGFAGLEDGDQAGWPQKISVKNVPAGTYVVYLYWADSWWSFTKIYANGRTGTLSDADEWYLYGDDTLKAYAVDKNYKILGTAKVNLKGW